jgi:hypothetical protein
VVDQSNHRVLLGQGQFSNKQTSCEATRVRAASMRGAFAASFNERDGRDTTRWQSSTLVMYVTTRVPMPAFFFCGPIGRVCFFFDELFG